MPPFREKRAVSKTSLAELVNQDKACDRICNLACQGTCGTLLWGDSVRCVCLLAGFSQEQNLTGLLWRQAAGPVMNNSLQIPEDTFEQAI